jgi:hypothetical protein
MLNAHETSMEYVSSMGLGGELQIWLSEVEQEVFEREESEVEAALWPVRGYMDDDNCGIKRHIWCNCNALAA